MEVTVNAWTLSAAVSMLLLLLVAAGCSDDDSRRNGGGEFGVLSSSRHNVTRKDMTLVHGDSRLQTDSLPDRIRRLRREIARGEEVYTREELEILQRKMTECEEQSRVIQNP